MAKKHLILTLGTLAASAPANAQTAAAPPPADPAAQPRASSAVTMPEAMRETMRPSQAERDAMAAREEEALSKPAAWGEMSRDELEKSVGGRTLLEIKVQQATLEAIADSMRAASGVDIFTQPQIIPQLAGAPPFYGPPGAVLPAYKPPTFSFDISKRPFWEAVRAMILAQAAREKVVGQVFAGSTYGFGRSIFNDISGPRNELFAMQRPFAASSLGLSPVHIVPPDPRSLASLGGTMITLSPEQKANWLRQMQAPSLRPASPRADGALWQLGRSSPFEGGDLSRGRSFSSWPCLFVLDYIARKQDNYLAPDASEAPPKPQEPAKAPPAAAPGAGGVLPRMLPGAPAALDEWQQSVALQMRAYVDPRVRQYRNVRLVVDEASDESGHDLRRDDFTRPRQVRLGERADLDLAIALSLPRDRPAKSDRLHLRGALLFWVPARISTAEFALGADGTAARQAIFFGQAAGLKMKLSRGEGKAWLLSSDVELKGDQGQLDFRRELGPALSDDDGYRAGLTMPGSVRVQSADGCEWTLRPFGEEQKLTLNAGENLISHKTNYVGAFRRARNATGTFEGTTSGNGAGYSSASGSLVPPRSSNGSGNLESAVGAVPVPPDGYAYTENVTWQLEPGHAAGGDGGACGTGEEPPAISKIFFDTPQEWREVRVPFEFRDLPLPPR